jgi:hypothetical protein
VAAFVQSVLPSLRDAAWWLAALHPVNAMLVFGLSVLVARRAVTMARMPASAAAGDSLPENPRLSA